MRNQTSESNSTADVSSGYRLGCVAVAPLDRGQSTHSSIETPGPDLYRHTANNYSSVRLATPVNGVEIIKLNKANVHKKIDRNSIETT